MFSLLTPKLKIVDIRVHGDCTILKVGKSFVFMKHIRLNNTDIAESAVLLHSPLFPHLKGYVLAVITF